MKVKLNVKLSVNFKMKIKQCKMNNNNKIWNQNSK